MKVGANIGWEPNTWTFTCFVLGEKAVPKGKWKLYSLVSWRLQWSVALKCPRHQHLFSRPGFGIDFWWVFWQSIVKLIFVCSELCEIHKFETSPSLSALPGASLGVRSTGPLAALWKMSNIHTSLHIQILVVILYAYIWKSLPKSWSFNRVLVLMLWLSGCYWSILIQTARLIDKRKWKYFTKIGILLSLINTV